MLAVAVIVGKRHFHRYIGGLIAALDIDDLGGAATGWHSYPQHLDKLDDPPCYRRFWYRCCILFFSRNR